MNIALYAAAAVIMAVRSLWPSGLSGFPEVSDLCIEGAVEGGLRR